MALVAVAGCDKGITDASCELCSEMRIRTDKAEYRPGAKVVFSITNRTTDVLRYDWCSVTAAARTDSDVPFEVRYTPSRRCGFTADVNDVLEHMQVMQPGATILDSLNLNSGSVQAQYRLHVWMVDETGLPETGNPVASNTFDVFPGASQLIRSR